MITVCYFYFMCEFASSKLYKSYVRYNSPTIISLVSVYNTHACRQLYLSESEPCCMAVSLQAFLILCTHAQCTLRGHMYTGRLSITLTCTLPDYKGGGGGGGGGGGHPDVWPSTLRSNMVTVLSSNQQQHQANGRVTGVRKRYSDM